MAKPTVQNILDEIETLTEDERLTLDKQLAERLEAEWSEEARQARELARQRNIDQSAIDAAVQRRRYGR